MTTVAVPSLPIDGVGSVPSELLWIVGSHGRE